MGQLNAMINKELLLIRRDLHSLMLLFAMPALFILIMTFALQNQYKGSSELSLNYFLLNKDNGALSQQLIAKLEQKNNFVRQQSDLSEEQIRQQVAADKAKLLVIIATDFSASFQDGTTLVSIETAPGTTDAISQLFKANLHRMLNDIYLSSQIEPLLGALDDEFEIIDYSTTIETNSLYQGEQQHPSSVQQNVPAWLLFAMFFIAIPLSTTLISERTQGTHQRLRSIGVSTASRIIAKMVPYFFISLLQIVLMLAIGVYLVPLLGGDRLELGASLPGLMLIASSCSVAAISYALLIAQLSRSLEQATLFSGASNIIMAAIGGIMVPVYIMPSTMQSLSKISPMNWGLEGFLDIFLRTGNITDVVGESAALLGFSLVMILLSTLAARRQSQH